MLRTKIIWQIAFAIIFFIATWAPADDLPKWRSNPKNFTKITEDRQIIASVNAEKISGSDQSLMRMDGGGLVRLTAEEAFVKAQRYENLKAVSDHIVEVRVGPAPTALFVHTQALKWHAQMYMTVKTEKEPVRRIRFAVDDGSFKGMTGDFGFEDYKGKTLLTFHSEYKYKVLPMPAFFVEFALEIVLQQVAGKMRAYLEAN